MPFKPLTQQSNNRTAFEFWIEDIIANIVGKRKKKKSPSRTDQQKLVPKFA